MKNIFPGYYRPTEEEFSNLWNSCLFVLDANVLLNLYRYSQETSDHLIQILKQVSDRLWVPHQTVLEYQDNRLTTIAKQSGMYDEIQNLVEDNKNKLKNKLEPLDKRHPYIKSNNLMKIMQKACDDIEKHLKKLKQKHPDLLQYDNLREALSILLEEKIGLPYSQKKLHVIYNLGKQRYEQKIPPGYADKDKESAKKYGDLILWFQIIDKAKQTNKPIILVTDDRKEDWWKKSNNKTIEPRPELVNEIFSEAGVSFYLYQTDPFMKNAEKLLGKKIKGNKKAIDEVREIRERDEEIEQKIKEITMTTYKLADAIAKSSAMVDRLSSSPLADAIAISSAMVAKLSQTEKLSDAISSAIQETKSWYPALKKGTEKAEDSNLSTDFEPKEIGKNEKDCQKEK